MKPPKYPQYTPLDTPFVSNRERRRTVQIGDEEVKVLKSKDWGSYFPFSRRGGIADTYTDTEGAVDGSASFEVERRIRIPRIDTGEVFGGLSAKKRRIYKVSLRVINTADIEVGVKGQPFSIVEALKGRCRTGEFDVLLSGEADTESELVIRQTKPSPFCLTSLTPHLSTED